MSGSELRGPLYLDASALAKLYLPEAESDALNLVLRGRSDVLVSDLTITETTSALCRRQRQGDMAARLPARVHDAMVRGLAAGVFGRVELVPEIHRAAELRLLQADGSGLRGMDALHLALAKSSGARTMVCFDHRLRTAAAAVGLQLFPTP